jgi:hypothetical protein
MHATSRPFPASGAYKRTNPSSLIPHTSLGHPLPPSPSSIKPAPPRPSSAPVSLTLLPLLSSSLIHIVLELRHSLTNTMHPSPPPITLDSLAGDLIAASARHCTVDRPPQAPSGQIGPSTMIPYPRPTSPPLLRRKTGLPAENRRGPHRRSSPTDSSPVTAPRRQPPFLWHVGPRPWRRPRAVPRWRAEWAACPRGRALARARWAKIPPAQLARNSFSFSFFHFFFLFSYIYSYIDILCTKNSLKKL